MKTKEVNGKRRESVGKTNSKFLRKQDLIPCVMYGGDEIIHFSSHNLEIGKLVYTDKVYIVKLSIDGKEYQAILKDLQFHPVTDKIIHVDFIQVSEDKKIDISIPIILNGFSEGVKQGGKLALEHRRLKVKAFLKDLPDQLDVDITNLLLGKTIQIGDLEFENMELIEPKNWVIASVKLTRVARGMAEDEEGEEGEEGATEGATEGAEAPEGDAK